MGGEYVFGVQERHEHTMESEEAVTLWEPGKGSLGTPDGTVVCWGGTSSRGNGMCKWPGVEAAKESGKRWSSSGDLSSV